MSRKSNRPILVTGGAGFVGSNLADRLAREGHQVRVYDALSRPGVESNLEWLKDRHGEKIEAIVADIRDAGSLARAAEGVGAAFHLAAQVAVTTSMADPRSDLDINIIGTFNLLEALRAQRERIPLLFASTNKVYGDLASFGSRLSAEGYRPQAEALAVHGVPENQPLDLHTPYGCSKGAADQYVLDYARSYDLPAAVLRMSCIYGERQMGTEDQGWVAHFLIRALEGRPITLYGDGQQVRDICHIDDTCGAYLAAWRHIESIAGRAFNWGGGPDNAVSLRTLVAEIGALTGCKLDLEQQDWRPGDQRWFVADTRAIDRALELPKRTPWKEGLGKLARWLAEVRDLPRAAMRVEKVA